jgi:hypothetical protein
MAINNGNVFGFFFGIFSLSKLFSLPFLKCNLDGILVFLKLLVSPLFQLFFLFLFNQVSKPIKMRFGKIKDCLCLGISVGNSSREIIYAF